MSEITSFNFISEMPAPQSAPAPRAEAPAGESFSGVLASVNDHASQPASQPDNKVQVVSDSAENNNSLTKDNSVNDDNTMHADNSGSTNQDSGQSGEQSIDHGGTEQLSSDTVSEDSQFAPDTSAASTEVVPASDTEVVDANTLLSAGHVAAALAASADSATTQATAQVAVGTITTQSDATPSPTINLNAQAPLATNNKANQNMAGAQPQTNNINKPTTLNTQQVTAQTVQTVPAQTAPAQAAQIASSAVAAQQTSQATSTTVQTAQTVQPVQTAQAATVQAVQTAQAGLTSEMQAASTTEGNATKPQVAHDIPTTKQADPAIAIKPTVTSTTKASTEQAIKPAAQMAAASSSASSVKAQTQTMGQTAAPGVGSAVASAQALASGSAAGQNPGGSGQSFEDNLMNQMMQAASKPQTQPAAQQVEVTETAALAMAVKRVAEGTQKGDSAIKIDSASSEGTTAALNSTSASSNSSTLQQVAVAKQQATSRTVQINDQKFMIIKRSDTMIEVSLRPEGLGKLQIELNMEKGILSAQIHAADPAGKEIIERNLQAILDELSKDGIDVGEFSVALRDGSAGSDESQKGKNDSDEDDNQDGDINNKDELAATTTVSSHNGLISAYA